MSSLAQIKKALGITGDYHDDALSIYIQETEDYLIDAGVPRSKITDGIVARGVADLWNYGAGEGKLSPYFHERAIQLSAGGNS